MQRNYTDTKIEDFQLKISLSNAKLSSTMNDLDSLINTLLIARDAKAENQILQEAVDHLRRQIDILSEQTGVTHLKNTIEELENKIAILKQEKEIQKRDIDYLINRNEALTDRLKVLSEENQRLKSRLRIRYNDPHY